MDWVKKAYKVAERINRQHVFEVHLSYLIVRFAEKCQSKNWLPPLILELIEQRENLQEYLPNSITMQEE